MSWYMASGECTTPTPPSVCGTAGSASSNALVLGVLSSQLILHLLAYDLQGSIALL